MINISTEIFQVFQQQKILLIQLVVLLFLQFFDIGSTYLAVSDGSGIEVNPVVNNIADYVGFLQAIIILKMVVILFIVGAVVNIPRGYKKLVRYNIMVGIVNLIYIFVIINNFSIIGT